MRKLNILEKLLLISGISLIGSLLTANPFILTLTLTLFMLSITINMCNLFNAKNMISTVDEVTTNRVEESIKNKKYGTAIINTLALPAIIIGIIFVVADIVLMWSMVL